jgi:hypothetical protein
MDWKFIENRQGSPKISWLNLIFFKKIKFWNIFFKIESISRFLVKTKFQNLKYYVLQNLSKCKMVNKKKIVQFSWKPLDFLKNHSILSQNCSVFSLSTGFRGRLLRQETRRLADFNLKKPRRLPASMRRKQRGCGFNVMGDEEAA